MTAVQPLGARAWFIFFLCFSISALEGYDLQVLAVAVPGLRAQFGLVPQQLGVALSASLAGLALGALAGGMLADRIGRRGVLIGSVLSLGVFTLLTAFVRDYNELLIARALTGVSIGGAIPNLIATIAAIVGPRRTTTFVTAMMCGMPFGGVLSAVAGLTVVPTWGWPGVFYVGGALTLILSPFLIFGIPEVAGRKADPGAAVVSPAEALFGGGRAGATLSLWAVFILTLTIFSLLLGWAPTLVIDKGLPPAMASSVMLALNLAGILGAVFAGRLCDALGVRTAMLITFAGVAVGLALFAWASEAKMMIAASAVAGFFIVGGQFTLYGIAPRVYPAQLHGTGVGTAAAMGRIGSIFGPMLAGWLLASGMSVDNAVLAIIPLALAAGVAVILLTLFARDRMGATRPGSHVLEPDPDFAA
jgi:AAHS family 3-hydroxyphenylpropionic acid transporter